MCRELRNWPEMYRSRQGDAFQSANVICLRSVVARSMMNFISEQNATHRGQIGDPIQWGK